MLAKNHVDLGRKGTSTTSTICRYVLGNVHSEWKGTSTKMYRVDSKSRMKTWAARGRSTDPVMEFCAGSCFYGGFVIRLPV
jgi:hypothetical protein